MPSSFNKIAERRMLKALAEGKLSNLPGEGKPLPDHTADAFVDPGDAMGFRIMAEAGVLPDEIVFKKAIITAKADLAKMTDPAERNAAVARLSELMMRQSIAEEARRKFMKQ
jgi:hypothetical protein